MLTKIQSILFVFIISFLLSSAVLGTSPTTMNYQGFLTDASGNPVPDGLHEVVFAIYTDSLTATPLWNESRIVTTNNGLFSITLGLVNPITLSVFSWDERYLGIKVGTDPEISPRSVLSAVPYSFTSDYADQSSLSFSATKLVTPDLTHSTAVSVDDAGNVGIGTLTPSKKFHVVGDAYFTNKVGIGFYPSTNSSLSIANYEAAPAVYIYNSGGGGAISCESDVGSTIIAVNRNSTPPFYADTYCYLALDSIGVIGLSYTGSSGKGVLGEDGVSGNLGYLGGSTTGVYGEAANSTYKAGYFNGDVFVSTNIGIGTEAPSEELEIYSSDPVLNLNTTNVFGGVRWQKDGNGQWTLGWNEGSGYMYFYRYGFGSVMTLRDTDGYVGIGTATPAERLSVNGNICYTGSIGACSDIRYKKEVTTLENSLSNVLKLRGVTYKWKREDFPDREFDNKTHLGFIAQEIEKIYPEMVMTDDAGYKSVDYSRLTPVLVEAIKEQQKQIDELKQMVQKLADQNKAINATYGLK